MSPLEISLALAIACVLYIYAFYPALVAVLARVLGRPVDRSGPRPKSISIAIPAHNEETSIARRLNEFSRLVGRSGLQAEIIVVSDGSTDRTAAIAKEAACGCQLRVVELPYRVGKAVALSQGCALAEHEIIVLADARQHWAADALDHLLANFGDPAVGAVTGELVLESAPGVLAGVGVYWRFEKWLRKQESRWFSTVGVTGAICAVRRELFCPVPEDTLLDDVYWPIRVTMQGRRVVHDAAAIAYDRLPARPRDEFRRKVRTLSGNFQLVARLPSALQPWRNPVWLQFVSHKLMRLLVPWALLIILASSFLLPGAIYQAFFWAQVAFYGLGLIGFATAWGAPFKLASLASSFLMLNSAAWLAFWVWVSGNAGRTWEKAFEPVPSGETAA